MSLAYSAVPVKTHQVLLIVRKVERTFFKAKRMETEQNIVFALNFGPTRTARTLLAETAEPLSSLQLR